MVCFFFCIFYITQAFPQTSALTWSLHVIPQPYCNSLKLGESPTVRVNFCALVTAAGTACETCKWEFCWWHPLSFTPVLKCFKSSNNVIWEKFKPWKLQHFNLLRVHLWLEVWSMKIVLSNCAIKASSLFWTFSRILWNEDFCCSRLSHFFWHMGQALGLFVEDCDTAWPIGSVDPSTFCLFHGIAKPHKAREGSPVRLGLLGNF